MCVWVCACDSVHYLHHNMLIGNYIPSCQVPEWEEEVQFWSFEVGMAVVGVMSGLSLAVQRHCRLSQRHSLTPDTFHCLPGIMV